MCFGEHITQFSSHYSISIFHLNDIPRSDIQIIKCARAHTQIEYKPHHKESEFQMYKWVLNEELWRQ